MHVIVLESAYGPINCIVYIKLHICHGRYMLFRAGVPRHAIIKKFAGEDITKLDDFISVLSKLSRGARVPLEYISYTDRHRRKVLLVPLKYITGYTLDRCLLDKQVVPTGYSCFPCPSSGSCCRHIAIK